ncbi:MAG: hypothetical protein EBS41_08515, partial [Actinobacteria bacterium]|nr:hypothetical protein [Actinomycetota bacterium]
ATGEAAFKGALFQSMIAGALNMQSVVEAHRGRIRVESAPGKGTAAISGNTLTYTPTSSASGTDSFVVTASDGKGGSATQMVNATIDDYPNTTGSSGIVTVGGGASAGSIDFASDTDVFKVTLTAGETYRFDMIATSGGLDPYLYLFNLSDQTLTQVASNGDNGSSKNSQFTYSALASGTYILLAQDTASNLGSYNLLVERPNRSPSFSFASQSVSTNEDTAKAITLAATDADSDPLTYTTASAANGTVTVSGTVVTYTPRLNFNGSDSFVVTASDGKGGTATQTVNITVAAFEDQATGSISISGTASQGGSVTANVSAIDVDGAITGVSYLWQMSLDGVSVWTNLNAATS